MSVQRTMMLTAFGKLCDDQGRILLVRRKNTGYADGSYGMPGGRVELGESLLEAVQREVLEEVGCIVRPEDCELYAVHHVLERGIERIDAQFLIHRWEGEPRICEPDKADQIGWFSLDALPVLGDITKQAIFARGLWVTNTISSSGAV